MKKIISIVIALLCVGRIAAQSEDKGIFVELNVGHGHDNPGHAGKSYAILTPALGYRFAGNWSVGARVQCEIGEGYTTLGAFAQYRFLNRPRFDMFTEGVAAYTVMSGYDNALPPGSVNTSYTQMEAGFTFGVSYALTERLRVQARYLYIGYDDVPYGRGGACWGDGKFIVDANWRRLQVGLQYMF